MPDTFVHLHTHTDYSMLDGASRTGPLVEAVARMGMPAVAITDHGNMFGAVEFYRAAQAAGVKPVIGAELYVAPKHRTHKENRNKGEDPYYHLTVLAETQQGYLNLMRLVSRGYFEGFHHKPRVDRELLEKHREGLIVLSGCLGSEVNEHLKAGRHDEAGTAAGWYRDVFGPDHYFVELQDHGIAEQELTNPLLMSIADRLGVGLVVTNDSHYTDRSDAEAHDALLCVQTGSKQADADRFRFHNDQFYVKPAEQMHALFPDRPAAWQNTLLIAERCSVELEFGVHHLPRFDCPDGLTEAAYLRQKVHEGARQRYGDDPSDEVAARLEFELGVIEQMGFPGYFLIVADLCEAARARGIRVGPGRGSAAGCAVAYCTRITDLCPIEHGLLFERFLNPHRVSMPDIDIDFDESRRGEMIRYTADKYGHDKVAQIVTYSTIKAKQAIRDSARVLGYDYGAGDRLAKMMPPPSMGKDKTLAQGRETAPDLREAWTTDPDARKILDTALGLEGLKRQHSVHAAGVVIAPDEIVGYCPVLRTDDGATVTQYDGGQIDDLGLLKMDFLGLRNLTVITDALDHVERTTGRRTEIEDVPLDDAETYKMLAAGDTEGVFQLDSPGITALTRHMAPDRFEDVVALLALYRPGPMSAGLHNDYCERKHGRQPVSYPHADLAGLLEPTYGVLVYQEQVLKIAQVVAGFTLGEADLLRRAIGKKKQAEMDAQKDKFLKGTVRTGYPERLGADLWNLIEGFADYAFNKSHSAGYGLVSYQTAWLKRHHPAEYMAALLTSVKDNKDRLSLYLNTCRGMGIQVLQPDVNESEPDFAPAKGEQKVRFGLSAVKGVGGAVVASVVAERRRGGPYASFHDFADRLEAGVLNKRTADAFIRAGAFDSLGHPRKGLLLAAPSIVDQAAATKKAAGRGQDDLFAAMGGGDAGVRDAVRVSVPELEYSRAELLKVERDVLGLYVSDHPLRGLESLCGRLSSTCAARLRETAAGTAVTLAGIVTASTKKYTKKGAPYMTGTLEDMTGSVEIVLFSGSYERYGDAVVADTLLRVAGKVDDSDSPKLLVHEVAAADIGDAADAPLVVTVDSSQCAPAAIRSLENVLSGHPGDAEVCVEVVTRNGSVPKVTRLSLPAGAKVRRGPGLYAELKELFGPGAVGT